MITEKAKELINGTKFLTWDESWWGESSLGSEVISVHDALEAVEITEQEMIEKLTKILKEEIFDDLGIDIILTRLKNNE